MSNNYDYSNIDNYRMKSDIGEGNFGKVKLAIFEPTGEQFAIKILNKKKISKMKNKMQKEIEILTKLNHINVVFVYKIIETEKNFYIIQEYCKLGELFDYIVKKEKLDEKEASIFFYQLINGVEYIHSKGIAHRDLKPENLLLTEDKVLKIIDFGLCHEFNENEFLKTKCGSPSYAAPEIISMPNYDGFKIDIWCCGIILYAMLCGYLPFEGDSESENDSDSDNAELFKNILECEPELPDSLSNMSKDLIMRILNPIPEERISIKNIKKHPFYLKGKRLCKIDYASCEKEIIKARENFNKINRIETKGSFKKNNNSNKNIRNSNNIEENNKHLENNSIETLDKNNCSSSINKDNSYIVKTTENIDKDKNSKAKLFLFSQKSMHNHKNDINSFKKFNPINLHNYNQKKLDIISNRIDQILKTDINENNHFGLPYIGLKDAKIIFNYLLSQKINKNQDKINSNNTINANPEFEQIKYLNKYKSPIKFGPIINSKISRNSLGGKINSCTKNREPNISNQYQIHDQLIYDKIKHKLENNDLTINNNNNLRIYSPKSNEYIYNRINTYDSGNLTLSLNNERSIRRRKFNKYNYDYDYNFSTSSNKNIFTKESYIEPSNNTNSMSINQLKTIAPNNIFSNKNFNSILKNYYGNDTNYKSPEIKSIYNNIKINININSNTINKSEDKKKKYLNSLKFNEVVGNNENNYKAIIQKKKSSKKLLTEINNNEDDKEQAFKNIEMSPNKNNESPKERKEISAPKYKKNNNENNNNDKLHSSIEDETKSKTKNNLGRIKLKIKNSDNNRESIDKKELLKFLLFNNFNKNKKNKNEDLLTLNKNFLPKLKDHLNNFNYNNESNI